MEEYRDYINDIIQQINFIEEFVVEMNIEEFIKDKKTQFAVIRCLEVVGEAVSKIPEEIKSEYPEIPWITIKNMRNRLIHGYFDLNIKIIWNTIEKDIPDLKQKITRIQ